MSIGGTSWNYDFDDGTATGTRSLYHTFENPGVYDVTLSTVGPAGSDTYTLSIEVDADPILSVAPDTLFFAAEYGGPIPGGQGISVDNVGILPLSYTAAGSESWIAASPGAGGPVPPISSETISVDTSSLEIGTHVGQVTVSAPGTYGSPATVWVVAEVTDPNAVPGTLVVTPDTLFFNGTIGDEIDGQLVTVSNGGEESFDFTSLVESEWITLSPLTGVVPPEVEITVDVDIGGLDAGLHRADLVFAAEGALGSPDTVVVQLALDLPSTVGYWRFEDGSEGQPAKSRGEILDTSSMNDHGVAYGDPVYLSDVPVPVLQQTNDSNSLSLDFDGSDDSVRFGSIFPFHRPGDATLEFWIRINADWHQSVFWTRPDNRDINRFNIYMNSNNTFGFDYRNGDGTARPLLSGYDCLPILVDVWTHIAIVRTGNRYATYIESELQHVAVDTWEDLPDATGWTVSGRDGYEFQGRLDEIRVSSFALDPSQFLVYSDPPPADLVININANIHGDPASGHNPLVEHFQAGKYRFEIINPSIDPQAAYWSWNPWSNPSVEAWQTTYRCRPVVDPSADFGWCCASTETGGFYSTPEHAQTVWLSEDQNVLFYLGDAVINDNLGGVSLRIELLTPAGVDQTALIPAGKGLLQNYPNPFNPQTTIGFDLPGEQAVSLRVYDVSGRLVDVLVDGEVATQGRNEVVWQGRDNRGHTLPSGTYFYRLETGGCSETKRMTLVK